MVFIHNPDNEKMLDDIYIALSQDQNGEGIVSAIIDGHGHPVVTGDKRICDLMVPFLRDVSKNSGKKIKIYRFKKCEVIQEITDNH